MSKKRIKIRSAKRDQPKAARSSTKQPGSKQPGAKQSGKTQALQAGAETRAAQTPGGDHRMSSIRGTGVPAKRLPGPGAEGVEVIPLPWRERLEARLNLPLGHLEVLTGPAVASALDSLGAAAATRGRRIYLAEATADFSTVAHEVVHVLQVSAEPVTGPREATHEDTDGRVVEADAPAELEAAQVAERLAVEGEGSESPALEQSIEPGDVALLRATDPASDPTAKLDRALAETTTETSPASPKQSESARDSASAAPAADAARESSLVPTPESAPELEPSPTFDLPEMPATELSGDELAARQAEQAEALAAIDGADNPSGVVGAFADAPPSVKALAQGGLGGKIDGAVQKGEAEFTASVPEFHAEMGGTPLGEEEGAPPVAAPEIGEVKLEDGTPDPDHQPELPPTEAIGKFLANNEVVSFFSRLFGGGSGGDEDREQRAEAIGKSLNKVETTDSDIDTSPGEKPKVALEGETDPQRIDDQKGAGREQARGARNEAAKAVIEGPGPEKAQLRSMDEAKAIGELEPPQLESVSSASGAEKFQSLGMPEEVNAQFDADMHGSMRDSMGEARSAMDSAESERDTSREQALAEAESDRQGLIEKADTEQRDEVLEARKTIQTERQSTLDAQADGVRALETESEKASRANRTKIGNKVKEDEGKISKRYDSAETEAEGEMKKGEKDAEAERKASEEKSKNTSWWDRLKSWVKEQFAKLAAAIGKIFDAVRALVKKALDAARNFAKGLIDAVASFIKNAIAVFGEMLKGLVNTLLSDLFPDLARKLNEKIDGAVLKAQQAVDKAADDLKAGVDALVDSLQAGLDAILDVFQAAINLGLAVLAAAITGDWGEVARQLLEAALKVVGIEPEAFYAYVGKVMDTIGLIVDAPGTFLLNCVNAVTQGFQNFADNFLPHLKGGIIAWLTGALGDIQIPEKFDFFGVLDLGRQIMGLTWEWLKEKAAMVVGEKNVERMEYVLDYVDTVREEGWGGLFQRIQGELTGLAGMILGQIKDFLVTKLIMAAITWIASLFSPVGAIVKLLFTVWNLFLFLKDQLTRIAGIVKSVVDSITNIANGVLGAAAEKVEGALANLLPVAIDLVMKLLGVSGVSQKVREVIQGIRERIDTAANKLIAKAMKLFKPKKEQQEKPQDPAVEQSLEQADYAIGKPMIFEGGGVSHTLFIAVKGDDANVMMRSDERQVGDWLRIMSGMVNRRAETDGWDDAKKNSVVQALATASALHSEVNQAGDKLVDFKIKLAEKTAESAGQRASQQTAAGTSEDKLLTKEDALRDALGEILEAFGQGDKNAPVVEKFAPEIAQLPEFFRNHFIKTILKRHGAAWGLLTWPEIVTQSIETAKVFELSPFNTAHKVRQAFRKLVDGEMTKRVSAAGPAVWEELKQDKDYSDNAKLTGAFQLTILGDLPTFISAHILRRFAQGAPGPLEEIRRAWFEPINAARIVDLLDEDIEEGISQKILEVILDKSVSANAKLITGTTVIPFLCAVARGETWKEMGEAEFRKMWANAVDRRHISNAFRAVDRNNHEWIQISITDKVMNMALAAKESEGPEAGARWIQYQNSLRSPTKTLIFKPAGIYVREVPLGPTAPFVTTIEKKREASLRADNRKVKVLQGHPGAVYAPVEDNGTYRKDNAEQSAGKNIWHNTFVDTIKAEIPDSSSIGLTSIKDVKQKILNYFDATIWNPAEQSFSQPRFEYYFDGKGSSANEVDYEHVHKDQKDAYRIEREKLATQAGS